MGDFNAVKKMQPMAPIQMGLSAVSRLIGKESGVGVAMGFSQFTAGSMDLEVNDPEIFVLVEGDLTVTNEGTQHTLVPGEAIWMPAGSSVGLTVLDSCKLLYLILGR